MRQQLSLPRPRRLSLTPPRRLSLTRLRRLSLRRLRPSWLPLTLLLLAPALAPRAQAAAPTAGPPRAVAGGIEFRLDLPGAHQVFLAGSFNAWAPAGETMRRGEDGVWTLTRRLEPGPWQYKFVADGSWLPDPANPARVPDGFGGQNSALVVRANGSVALEAVRAPTPAPVAAGLAARGRPLHLALIWHQHQPRYFRDARTGEYEEPWVRLHCIKDYFDMAAKVKGYRRLKYSVNLTPVLMSQIEDLVRGYPRGVTDRMMRLTLEPAARLTPAEKALLLARFFDADGAHQIDPYPRYRELRDRRKGTTAADLAASVPLFSEQDYRDLQMWFNLAWFDPAFQEGSVMLPDGRPASVSRWMRQGRGFSESDKRAMCDLQMRIVRSVIPEHRRLQQMGRIEVLTTPYAHPILPLLVDTDLARQAMPTATLPSPPFRHPEDARWHAREAARMYRRLFGRAPRGMWPGEGSVAQAVGGIIRDAGFRWVATDQEILQASLGRGSLTAEQRFTPYRLSGSAEGLVAIFRDTGLSNDISFRYSGMDPVAAANDFLTQLHRIQESLADASEDHLVTVVLDGENAWQSYEKDGEPFFRALYSQLDQAAWLVPTTVSDYLAAHPAASYPRLDSLWAGSWDSHSFATWIGEPEENAGWSFLQRVRDRFPRDMATRPEYRRSWNALAAAEGSDWFWWYGKDKDSGHDEDFDRAFRGTLKTVFTARQEAPPAFLDSAIVQPAVAAAAVRAPASKGPETIWIDREDPAGDDHGPGSYTYPTNAVFTPGVYDITHFQMASDDQDLIFRFRMAGSLAAPWGGDVGFCLQGVDVYLDTLGAATNLDANTDLLEGRNASMPDGWQLALRANMDEREVVGADRKVIPGGNLRAWGEAATRTITLRVPRSLAGTPRSGWKVVALVVGHDGYAPGRVRAVAAQAGEWAFGGGHDPALEPRIIDWVDADGAPQEKVLSEYLTTGRPVRLPAIPVGAGR